MEHSAAIENYINGQFAKIDTILQHQKDPIFVEIVLEPSKVHAHHKVEIRVKTPAYFLVADHEGPEFYAVIDHVVDTMYRQICEKKRELVDDKKTGKGDWFKGA